jgi:hypothetical protein
MIIELPVLPSAGIARRYRMGYFAFSNNNLAIRKRCAEELGMYHPEARTSEDVDICFRAAHSATWVLCREADMTIRHKARKSLAALRRQLWGWGIRLGRPYANTGVKGIYLYWVNGAQRAITRHVEIERFPWLVSVFVTDFHVAHAFGVAALLLWLFGAGTAGAVVALAAAVFLWRALRDVRLAALPWWDTVKLAAVHYMANVVFLTASIISGFRHGMVLVPAAVLPPGRPEKPPPS